MPQLYEQVMRQCELSETLGYDTFFCAEHHFHEYGVVPDPAVMLSALAQRTRRVRLGTAISILTFHDPRRIAESYSMLDMMSGGRLVFGVGSGYLAHEFAGYDVEPKEKRDRFNENLDLVKRLMAGETLSYRGRFSKSEKAVLNVLPHERPRAADLRGGARARGGLPRRAAGQPHLHRAVRLVQGFRRYRRHARRVPQGPRRSRPAGR